MTMHRFQQSSDDNMSAIKPTRTRQLVSDAAEVPNRHDDWSAPQDVPGQRLLLTVSEAAQQLGIGRSLLYELLAEGQVESIHVGRLRRIPIDALADFIDRQRSSGPGVAMCDPSRERSNLAACVEASPRPRPVTTVDGRQCSLTGGRTCRQTADI
jgi:excisionase family DNA binding protein